MTTVIKGDSNINLDFSTGGRITGDFSNATVANRVAFQTTTTNGATSLSLLPNGSSTVSGINCYGGTDPANSNAAQFAVINGMEARIQATANGTASAIPMTFYTGGSERMRVDTSGNVLIGTSTTRTNYSGGAFTPAFQIEKAGDIRASITRDSDDASGPVIYLGKTRGTTVNSNTVVANGDNLGLLSFDGADGTNLVRGAAITAQVDGTPGSADMPGRLVFSTTADGAATATERMRIDSSGNVGIGTSAPGQRLEISNASTNTTFSTVGNQLLIRNSGTTADAYARVDFAGGSSNNPTASIAAQIKNYGTGATELVFGTFNTGAGTIAERARIDSSGRLLVGTTSAPGQTGGVIVADDELFVYNIPTTASGANCHISSGEGNRFYRSTSALKYKQDIRDLESIDINAFRPVRYKSKCENDDQTKDHFGFIADEAAEAGFEELVSRGVDGEVEGFQYDRMTVVLVKKLQEQQAIITALTARVEALEGTQP